MRKAAILQNRQEINSHSQPDEREQTRNRKGKSRTEGLPEMSRVNRPDITAVAEGRNHIDKYSHPDEHYADRQ